MKEITGNIFDPTLGADAICCTTNGIINKAGELIMGKGIALEFKQRYPGIAAHLGKMVARSGNQVYLVYPKIKSMQLVENQWVIFSFPTKHHWKDKSDINLIIKSCHQLVHLTTQLEFSKVLLIRPGCFNGGLSWEKEVKPAICDILDDRFYIVTPNTATNKENMNQIDNFDGEFRWLSNFCKAPIKLNNATLGALVFDSVECAYQACKCADLEEVKQFTKCTASQSKQLGKKVKLRANWDDLKNEIMLQLLRLKFQYPELRAKLIATGDAELVEGNYWHDNWFGACTCARCASIEKFNYLGRMLMQVRAECVEAQMIERGD